MQTMCAFFWILLSGRIKSKGLKMKEINDEMHYIFLTQWQVNETNSDPRHKVSNGILSDRVVRQP